MIYKEKIYKCVFDGNKLYRLTEREFEKSIELLLGIISETEFSTILTGKEFVMLPPRKTRYD